MGYKDHVLQKGGRQSGMLPWSFYKKRLFLPLCSIYRLDVQMFQVGLDTAVPDWIGHLRLEAPPGKIQEAVLLCQKMAEECIPHIKISPTANPPRRRSSMRQSLLDEVEHITVDE